MTIHLSAILASYIVRNYLQPLLRLQIHEDGRAAQLRANLLPVQHMEQHNLAAVKAQRFDGLHNRLGGLIEIRDDHYYPTPAQELLKVRQWLCEVRAPPRFRLLQPSQQPMQLTLAR